MSEIYFKVPKVVKKCQQYIKLPQRLEINCHVAPGKTEAENATPPHGHEVCLSFMKTGKFNSKRKCNKY